MSVLFNKLSAAKLESDAVFEFITEQMKLQPEKAKSVNAVILVKITKGGKAIKDWSKYFTAIIELSTSWLFLIETMIYHCYR